METNSMTALNRPKPFHPNKTNISKEWRIWKTEFLIYLELIISSNNQISDKEKGYCLLNCIGMTGIEALNNIKFENFDEQENLLDILLKKFDEIFDVPLSEVKERYTFFSRYKHPKESLDEYIADVKEQASKCNFGNQIEKFVIDMIILNMDKECQQLAFNLEETSLSNIIQLYNQRSIFNEALQAMIHNKSPDSKSENIFNERSKTYYQSVLKKEDEEKSKNYIKICKSDKLKYIEDKDAILKQKFNSFNDDTKNSSDNPVRNNMELINKLIQSKSNEKEECFNKDSYNSQNKQQKSIDTVNQNNETTNIMHNKVHKPSEIKLDDCLWCEKKHPQDQCPHVSNCMKCDLFPHNICFHCKKNPHDENCFYKIIVSLPTNITSKAGPLCSKCQTDHAVFTRCPAFDATCYNCFGKGHYTTACKRKILNEETDNISKYTPFINGKEGLLISCLWCESRHLENRCPHDNNCRRCDIFPHNICFNCKKNPHHESCLYNNVELPNVKKLLHYSNCYKCRGNHAYTECPAKNTVCTNCFKIGHYNWACHNQVFLQTNSIKFTKNTKYSNSTTQNLEQKTKHGCPKCGCKHLYGQCLAYSEKCSYCDKYGHFEWKCKSQLISRELEDCSICKLKQLQHLNRNRYFCNHCMKFYFINTFSKEEQPKDEQSSCIIS